LFKRKVADVSDGKKRGRIIRMKKRFGKRKNVKIKMIMKDK